MDTSGLKHIIASPVFRGLLALALVLLLGALFHADGAFYKWDTHRDMFRQISVYGILACGLTLVIVAGGIDLSVGSVLGLVAVSFTVLAVQWQWPWPLAVAASIGVGMACGATSGTLIAWFGLQPFIATLALMVFARGLAKYVTGGQKVSNFVLNADGSFVEYELPPVFEALDTRLFGGNIATVSLVLLGCVVLCGVVLGTLRLGRYLYALGGNEEAAHLSGVPVKRAKIVAYVLSGAFAAVAGICQAAQERQGDPEAGFTYELTAIAIVVIGGTNLMGGRGGILLTLLGTLTIGYLEKILSINAVGEASRLMLTGAIIVGAVMLQRVRK